MHTIALISEHKFKPSTFINLSISLSLMDLPHEDLQQLTLFGIVKETISILKSSPKTFLLISLTLIFPQCLTYLIHMSLIKLDQPITYYIIYESIYLVVLFVLSLLSTTTIVFAVASLYTSKPVSFSSTISAVPRVFKQFFITFIIVWLFTTLYFEIYFIFLQFFHLAIATNDQFIKYASLGGMLIYLCIFHYAYTEHSLLPGIVSILEPVNTGWEALEKGRKLIEGKEWTACAFVFIYIVIYWAILLAFRYVVQDYYWMNYRIFIRIVFGLILAAALVVVTLISLLGQCVFYYVGKSHHGEVIDKRTLYERLDRYLGQGEDVPLTQSSDIQMESLDP